MEKATQVYPSLGLDNHSDCILSTRGPADVSAEQYGLAYFVWPLAMS